jgi:SH3-like domain-containing protein
MKTNGLRQYVRIGIMVATVMMLSAASTWAAEFVSVTKDGVNLRSGPTTEGKILFQLPAGYPLQVVSRQDKWIKVSDFEGDKGWIFGTLVSQTPYVIVKVKEANVRKGPGTNYEKVGSVAREVILRKMETKGEWVKVSHPKITGWLHSKLLWP